MALIDISNQYRYTGRGPFDAKALVKTYADLLNPDTWSTTNALGNSIITAYNGLVTAVCLNKEDVSKNGVYFLYDPEVTSPLKTPNVSLESNWHRLGDIKDITMIAQRLEDVRLDLEKVSDYGEI